MKVPVIYRDIDSYILNYNRKLIDRCYTLVNKFAVTEGERIEALYSEKESHDVFMLFDHYVYQTYDLLLLPNFYSFTTFYQKLKELNIRPL